MNIKRAIKEYTFVAIGTLLVAIGIFYFMAPQNLAAGGVSGFSIVLTSYIPLPISAVTLIINTILLIIGFIFIGKEFGGKTILSVVLLSFYLFLMETFFPISNPVTDEILLNLFCGIIISGGGLTIVFNQNASTGGTDIIAILLNKYLNLNIGTGMLAADAFVVGSALFTFGISKGIIGALGWFLNGLVINYFIDGLTIKKEVVIVSDKATEIKNFIFSEIDRGVTIYKAQGGYTNKPKDIVVTVVGKKEYFSLKKKLKTIDSDVFVLVRSVHEVLGHGFE
ncbi:YitT family protein [Sedimentibacter sp. zth1]|uniref:YitT family protein n=1 Tax=Sedimentibacter sp. zth1 TaxID=2816908 RepID=UPI001A9342B9|nr:YitT family protein [Sedimentibacter sp. zth1]QSX05796.1 YitT family protein [Sedimentibacter sp. zth1]